MGTYQNMRISKTTEVTWDEAVAAFNAAYPEMEGDMKACGKYPSSSNTCVIRSVKVGGKTLFVRSKVSSATVAPVNVGNCNYVVSSFESKITGSMQNVLDPDGTPHFDKLLKMQCPNCSATWRSSQTKTKFCPECGGNMMESAGL